MLLEDCKPKLIETKEEISIINNKVGPASFLRSLNVTSSHFIYRIIHDIISLAVLLHNTNTHKNKTCKSAMKKFYRTLVQLPI